MHACWQDIVALCVVGDMDGSRGMEQHAVQCGRLCTAVGVLPKCGVSVVSRMSVK